jgi:hypothetical protein
MDSKSLVVGTIGGIVVGAIGVGVWNKKDAFVAMKYTVNPTQVWYAYALPEKRIFFTSSGAGNIFNECAKEAQATFARLGRDNCPEVPAGYVFMGVVSIDAATTKDPRFVRV